jgi:hypothetical protein
MALLTMAILTAQGDAALPEVELRRWGYLAVLPWAAAVVGLGLFDMVQAILSIATVSTNTNRAMMSRAVVSRAV